MEEQKQGRPAKEVEEAKPESAMENGCLLLAIFQEWSKVGIFRSLKHRSKPSRQFTKNCKSRRPVSSSQAGIGSSIKESRGERTTLHQKS